MTNCPLISFQRPYNTGTECMGEDCMWWSLNKDGCLVHLALLKYTADAPADEKDSIESKIKILENQVRAIGMGFPVMNFNTEYKMGLNTAKHPPEKPVGGDTADTPDTLNFPGFYMGGL